MGHRARRDRDRKTPLSRARRVLYPHLPEVVLVEARQSGRVDTDLFNPYLCRLVVTDVDRYPQTIRRQRQSPREKLPGKPDGLSLEVIAKTEVTEHFKEGVVSRGVSHILKIVVLAASAHALLSRHSAHIGPLLEAEKRLLELIHASVGEK